MGQYPELMCFWATLAQFWPWSGKKITDNGPKWWFLTIIWKSIHAIQLELAGYTYWVSVQKWFAFWSRWPDFGPILATKLLKMVISDHCLKKYSCDPIQTWCVHLFGECAESISFLATLAKFWPSSGLKMVVTGYYLKNCSCNLIQTWCVCLMGKCSELICFWATLTKFWPSSGHKMTENGGFWPNS